jgi:flagellar protein FlgJ
MSNLNNPPVSPVALKPLHPTQGDATNPVAPAADAGALPPAVVAKATKAAVEFESFFISHMLHQMREIAPEDSPTNNKINQDMVDMVDGMLAGHLAGQRAFGVADAILKQILPTGLNKPG